ncbi:hypothetical protein [Planctomonas deserti]|uniref:hypothetical protein n=1 Tax=Planctomonas deserti TaxID=2144185 RepID=UPI000D3AE1BE|nr:hypothetical protein [Planctomonas deserti]
MTSAIEENTLGGIAGIQSRRTRPIKTAGSRPASVGTDYLGFGTALIFLLIVACGLVQFVIQLDNHPDAGLTVGAWILLIGVGLVAASFVGRNSSRLPNWAFAALLAGLAGAVALDLIAVLPQEDIGRFGTASVSVGGVLVLLVTLRRSREIITAAAVVAAVLVGAMLLTRPGDLTPDDPALAALVVAVARVMFPAVVGVVVVTGFRRIVQIELDRVQVQSTVSAPRFAVGMLASEELARLDLAAERLLEDVATGAEPLPLSPQTASTAASLATELRLHLIEGRRETWLHHAISESEFLGPSVRLVDPGALAGLMHPRQRDGLLSAAWLLLTSSTRQGVTVQLTLGPIKHPAPGTNIDRKVVLPIVIGTTGIPRKRVNPSLWEALGKVGSHVVQVKDGSIRVEIDCIVGNPADQ